MVDGLPAIDRTNEELYDSRFVRRKPPRRQPAHDSPNYSDKEDSQDAFEPEDHNLDVRA